MKQYILLVHDNAKTPTTTGEWDQFFAAAQKSGGFRGGSAIGDRCLLGRSASQSPSSSVVGYMRFDAEDKEKLLDLLKTHPVLAHEGSVELCELVKS